MDWGRLTVTRNGGDRKPCKADPVAQCNAYVGNGTTIADVRAIATKKSS